MFLNLQKNKEQIYMVYQIEPAQDFKNISIVLSVNWTATYRRDSVPNTPYVSFTPYLNVKKLPNIPKRN